MKCKDCKWFDGEMRIEEPTTSDQLENDDT